MKAVVIHLTDSNLNDEVLVQDLKKLISKLGYTSKANITIIGNTEMAKILVRETYEYNMKTTSCEVTTECENAFRYLNRTFGRLDTESALANILYSYVAQNPDTVEAIYNIRSTNSQSHEFFTDDRRNFKEYIDNVSIEIRRQS